MTVPSVARPLLPHDHDASSLRYASLGRPGLAAIRIDAAADGVAYVARLLARALDALGSPAYRAELAPRAAAGPTTAEQLLFLARVTAMQVRDADWVLYAHLGLARAQRFVPRPWRRPYAVFLHGTEVWDTELSLDRRAALRGARLRLANSSFTARRVAAVHPDSGPIVACPLALLPEEASVAPHSAQPPILAALGSHGVVIIGRMSAEERYKGHDELIECWPAVLEAVPDARLVVVGMGNDRDRLMRKAGEAGVAGSVIFPGFVDDATRDALLSRAAVFAMPSRGEGFGIVYLQAMRAGTACIGSSADAAGDVIVEGETGRLVDPADRQALANAIVALLADESLRNRMGAAGRRRFEAEFTFDRFRDRLGVLLARSFGPNRERD